MKRRVALGLLPILLALSSPTLAQGPAEQLRDATMRVLGALQDRTLRESGNLDELRTQIRTVMDEIFDWREMSRQVLSPHWAFLSADQRDEFTALFGDVLQRSYLSRVAEFRDEQIELGSVEATVDGTHGFVRTKLVTKSSGVSIAYRVIADEGRWKVYDLAVEGISILSSSHSQIGRLVKHFGYGGMMTALRMKRNRLMIEENERATVSHVDRNP